MKRFTAFALESFPLIESGDNVAKVIVGTTGKNRLKIEEGDIMVISHKIFSKAENRVAKLSDVVASSEARKIAEITGKDPRFAELVLRETKSVIKASPEILIVKDRRNLVCINAGIDKSNIEGIDSFALLPQRPDISAKKCRLEIRRLTGKNVAVIICDTYSRPFRRGQVNFAIGMSGIYPFKDYRGKKDLFGQILRVKNIAIIDEIAAAAELLMGQAKEATPVVIFKGLSDLCGSTERSSIDELYILDEEDLFRRAL